MNSWNAGQLRAWLAMTTILIPVPVRKIVIASCLFIVAMVIIYFVSQQLLSLGQTAQKTIKLHTLLAPHMMIKEKVKQKIDKPVKKSIISVAKQSVVITTASVMTYLRKIARQNKLHVRELSTDVRQEQDGNRMSVQMEARANYANIKLLLKGLQGHYSQLRIEKIRIEKHKRGSLILWLRFSPGLLERS